MKPRIKAHTALSVTRSKAKMYEYNVPIKEHIRILEDPAKLFDLTIGILGDFAALQNLEEDDADFQSLRHSLRFSSYFFDAYLKTRLHPLVDDYLLLLGASAYFLCDLPGSSKVLVSKLNTYNSDKSCNGFDNFLIWVLIGDFSNSFTFPEESPYLNIINKITKLLRIFQTTGKYNQIIRITDELRFLSMDIGTDREVLLVDVSISVIKKRISMSTWKCLPEYTDISIEDWSEIIPSLQIKELWPAQRLLGEKNVYKGVSAVVQMPTSAGKTKATELILRSSFLSNRASLAVIVAPFRALCSEIHDDLQKIFSGENISVDKVSDSIQTDFSIEELLGHKQIIIVTPEKFDFMLRYEPTLSEQTKLLIYDEGHLFDDTSRGVKYELLLASLKAKISPDSQVVLISAVMSNANEIKDWLLNDEATVVTGTDLMPTYRTIAFTSWKDKQLHFVSPEKPDTQVFFVPRVFQQVSLEKIGKETKERLFPVSDDGNDIALYLGLKLLNQGTVAIFTGRKLSVSKLVNRILEIYLRGYTEATPVEYCDNSEIAKLNYIYKLNFGENYDGTKAAKIGVCSHHGDVPQGIRLSVEYALQSNLIKFVICTSTLAQGINLPLRYLIVTNTRHSQESIKTRDFHNLLGRAGRAGMYTEGSIIFANPELWDNKDWRWDEAVQLLDFNNSEPCLSYLGILFKPLVSPNGREQIELDTLNLVTVYLEEFDSKEDLIDEFAKKNGSKFFPENDIKAQFRIRFSTVSTIESYLLANIDIGDERYEEKVADLAKGTLAYTQLGQEEQVLLVEIFILIAKKIIELEPSFEKRVIYSRTFQGIHDSLELSRWVSANRDKIKTVSNIEVFIETFWPIFLKYIKNSVFRKIESKDLLKQACIAWMKGDAFINIYELLSDQKVGTYNLKMEHVVGLCEGGWGFDGSIMIGAVSQLLELEDNDDFDDTLKILQSLQKNMKYGLPSPESIILYEIGFSDRCLAQAMMPLFSELRIHKSEYIKHLKTHIEESSIILNNYPSYFTNRLQIILSEVR